MSIVQQVLSGSLLGNERLMRAREFYMPLAAPITPETALARWTRRVSIQSEIGSARELAGLSDTELANLEAEFLRRQMRPRAAWERHAVVAGLALVALACAGLVLQGLIESPAELVRTMQTASVAVLLVGMVPLAGALFAAFGQVHLDLSHGTTGLLVGTLDEHHPWLYRAKALTVHAPAEEYRLRVLVERGLLRGADYIVMRELVRAHESVQEMQPARGVAEQLQLLPAPVEAGAPEPRLVRVGGARGG